MCDVASDDLAVLFREFIVISRADVDVVREDYSSAGKVNTVNAVVAVDKRDACL